MLPSSTKYVENILCVTLADYMASSNYLTPKQYEPRSVRWPLHLYGPDKNEEQYPQSN